MRILIVEDEKRMAELLKKGLEEENHSASVALDGREGLEAVAAAEFDMIILDLMLPGVDGFEFARRFRRVNDRTPMLVLTARDSISDIVKALDLGVDDYLTKPFSFDELLARVRALARRGTGSRAPMLRVSDLVLDPAAHRVYRGDREIHLSPTEYRLLEFLMRRADRVVTRDAIVNGVWGFEQDIQENTLDAFVSLLRGKIDKGFRPRLIQTIKGVGYSVRKEL
jgi:DNA-binding response OmpR family regulator